VALLALDLGVVITASHNPPAYNGVKFFDRGGSKLSDGAEEEIEALLDTAGPGGGRIDHVDVATDSYLEHIVERFGSDLSGLTIAVDCANGAYAAIAPEAFEQLGADVVAIGVDPDGTNINQGCGATDLVAVSNLVRAERCDLGVAFDGDGDRMLAVDAAGEVVDGDQILAVLALHLGVDVVAVTVMTNLGFHRLLEERGVRVVTTDVGDRYVLEALRSEGGVLGGEQSGHVLYLRNHVAGDGLTAALLLCRALAGRSAGEAAAVLERYPQVTRDVRVRSRELTPAILDAADRLNGELGERGRVLVRASGTEPMIRVLTEGESLQEAESACGSIAALVFKELG
jgi:phosphoglucosamine mutase